MNREEIIKLISNINVWKNGDQRAPHKPLLLLYALGKINVQENRMLPYEKIMEDLKGLLIEFGPNRSTIHTNYPFIRLANDDIWELKSTRSLNTTRDYSDKSLLDLQTQGGIKEDIYTELKNNQYLKYEIAEILLESSFPSSLHEDILSAVGLDRITFQRRRRDPGFRNKVLHAYGYRCAICGFDLRIRDSLVGIEAAHIKWHQAGGTDTEDNGLALCNMHHKLFDKGAFTIKNNLIFKVSEMVNGTSGLKEWLFNFHDKAIREPVRINYQPNSKYLEWHRREVFRGVEKE